MSIGTTIKTLRRSQNMTQEQLAYYMSITAPAVSQWECDRTTPDILQIPALAEVFKVSTDFLLGVDVAGKDNESENGIADDAVECPDENVRKQADALLDKSKELFSSGYNLSDELMNRLHRRIDTGDIESAEKIIGIGVKLYPCDYNLPDELIYRIRRCFNRGDIDMAEKIIGIGIKLYMSGYSLTYLSGYNLSDELIVRIRRCFNKGDIESVNKIVNIGIKFNPCEYNLSDELMRQIRRCFNRGDIEKAGMMINHGINC